MKKIVAYHKGFMRVNLRDEANFVTIESRNGKMVDFIILPKIGFDTARDEEKPVKFWNELPVEI